MIQGCTAVHIFTVPFDVSEIENLSISYKQGDILVKKQKTDCTLAEKTISVVLTPEDTLKFNSNSVVKCQIKVKRANITNASDMIYITVGEILDKEVL